MGKLQEFRIVYEHESAVDHGACSKARETGAGSGVYKAGDTVRGHVYIKLTDAMQMRSESSCHQIFEHIDHTVHL